VTFAGFPSRPQSTAIPNVFFSDLLPALSDDASALGVILYAFNALSRSKGFPRFITADDLVADPAVAAFAGAEPRSVIDRGLARACEIGVLLPLCVRAESGPRTLYFLNAPADRRGLEAVRSRDVDLGRVAPAAAARDRRSIHSLYESLIGTISPLVADDLAEAERLYPAEWLEAAFREAAAQNARSWRYVSRILERWAIEGRDHAKTGRDPADGNARRERYFGGKYGRILKQRLDG
jgi:DnaD/phage-associated family protein